MEKINKQVILSIIIGVVLYFLLTIYGDIGPVIQSFQNFNWYFIPLLLLLSIANYLFRLIKWNYFLKILDIKASSKLSASVFFSGLIMSVTPMKAGELLKSVLLKQILNEPISKTAPVVFAERVTDFFSLIIICSTGVLHFGYGFKLIVPVALFFILIVIIISNRKICLWFFAKIEKIGFVKKHSNKLYNLYESSYLMFKIKPLLSSVALGVVSWFFECIAFYFILCAFNPDISLFMSSFIYTFSTIFGAISMLPGGLGVTEGSLTFLMIQNGFTKENAIASTLIIRVVTLWFAVVIGIVSLYLFQKKFGNLINNGQNKEK